MSSADRCCAGLDSSISRIFTRGSVTLSPAFRRSLVSTGRRPGGFEYYCSGSRSKSQRISMRKLLALCLALTLPACGLVYKLPTRQGNVIEQKQIDQLKVGMSRDQVKFLMGT